MPLTHFRRFARQQAGATAIEYALIASLVAMAIIAALAGIGSRLGTSFNNVSGNFRGT